MIGAKQRLNTRSGFTLIEILIVVALFSMAMLILSEVFLAFNRLHRKISNQVVLSQDMRFATELLVRESRNKAFNYDPTAYLSGTVASSSEMHLIDADGTQEDIAVVSGASCGDVATINCLALRQTPPGGVASAWSPITSKHVNVLMFGSYVRPTVSPFIPQSDGSYVNVQPMATIVLNLQYATGDVQTSSTLEAQTTVSSRIYQR